MAGSSNIPEGNTLTINKYKYLDAKGVKQIWNEIQNRFNQVDEDIANAKEKVARFAGDQSSYTLSYTTSDPTAQQQADNESIDILINNGDVIWKGTRYYFSKTYTEAEKDIATSTVKYWLAPVF